MGWEGERFGGRSEGRNKAKKRHKPQCSTRATITITITTTTITITTANTTINRAAALQWTCPTQLHGIGRYAADAYYIFCRGKWREVEPDDKDLRRYRDWLAGTGGAGAGLQRGGGVGGVGGGDAGGGVGGGEEGGGVPG